MLKRIRNLFNRNKEIPILSVDEKIDGLFDSLKEKIITVHIGLDLVKYGDIICDIISDIREEIKDECGFIIPAVKIKNNIFIQENELIIYVRGKQIKNSFLVPNEQGIREEFYELFKSIVYDSINSIFTNEITEKYINTVKENNSLLIWNLTNVLSTIDIKTILTDIILKGKSIEDINYVFEKIGELILSGGEFKDTLKKYNPHTIAKQVIKSM